MAAEFLHRVEGRPGVALAFVEGGLPVVTRSRGDQRDEAADDQGDGKDGEADAEPPTAPAADRLRRGCSRDGTGRRLTLADRRPPFHLLSPNRSIPPPQPRPYRIGVPAGRRKLLRGGGGVVVALLRHAGGVSAITRSGCRAYLSSLRASRPVTHPERVLHGLGQALQEARDKRGLTQEALSLETGVHRNYIGGIERGERSPSVEAVVKLADVLG